MDDGQEFEEPLHAPPAALVGFNFGPWNLTSSWLTSFLLNCRCPDMNDMSAVVARGFDPLLANLFYLYGTALLYTYITTTSMFGDAAQKNVNEVATTMDENTEGDAALVEMLLQELAGGGEEGEEVAIQNKPTSDPVLTAGGGKVSAKEEEEEKQKAAAAISQEKPKPAVGKKDDWSESEESE